MYTYVTVYRHTFRQATETLLNNPSTHIFLNNAYLKKNRFITSANQVSTSTSTCNF